jgi:hypothetical protein
VEKPEQERWTHGNQEETTLWKVIFMTLNIKHFYLQIMVVFWVVAPCSLVEFTNVSETPYDGGSMDLCNIGKLILEYTVLQPI